MISPRLQNGFTLIEMVVILFALAVLVLVADANLSPQVDHWQVRRAVSQVYDDLENAQETAAKMGNYRLTENGVLAASRIFMVFNQSENSYLVSRWTDDDGDGNPETGESTLLYGGQLPAGVGFGFSADVDRKACGNGAGRPADAVSFAVANYPPCEARECIRFNKFGFTEGGLGGIYLNRKGISYALSMTMAGNINLCRWKEDHWESI